MIASSTTPSTIKHQQRLMMSKNKKRFSSSSVCVRSGSARAASVKSDDDDDANVDNNNGSVNRRNALLAMTVIGTSAAQSARALDLGSLAEDLLKEKDMSANEDTNAIKAKRAVNLPIRRRGENVWGEQIESAN